MVDPSIQSYRRSFDLQEIEDFGTINLHEHNFGHGIFAHDKKLNAIEIPESFGRFMYEVIDTHEFD